jgi:long-chain acyl-CoA synthetase
MMKHTDIIPLEKAKTLHGAFYQRQLRSPDDTAYVQYDRIRGEWISHSWKNTAEVVGQWQQALGRESLETGDRVAIMLKNCWEWVLFDQAALGLGLVTVPLFPNDRPDNIAYILEDSDAKLLFLETDEQWISLQPVADRLQKLRRIVSLESVEEQFGLPIVSLSDWLSEGSFELITQDVDPDSLATIVYTSGTTGKSKGVMLSHRNILWNAEAGLKMIDVFPDDISLSFLPLPHTLERTVGYYLMILSGATVTYARSIAELADDLVEVKPTILISVPRIFERVYAKIQEKLEHDSGVARFLFNKAVEVGLCRFNYTQGRSDWHYSLLFWPLLEKIVARKVQAKLGGRLRFAISGGAALSVDVAQLFIGLGIPIQQGYGLTESSPIISVNALEDNIPESIGKPLPGVEIMVGDDDELLTRSPSVMLGYWKNNAGTAAIIDEEGWLHTGDQVRIVDDHIYITGRIKEIIVMANGEKISPADMEMAIAMESLIDQVIVIGEKRPYLSALVVPNLEKLKELAKSMKLNTEADELTNNEKLHEKILSLIHNRLRSFPGYAEIRRIGIIKEAWSIENGMMTPTLKLKRSLVLDKYNQLVDRLYSGH